MRRQYWRLFVALLLAFGLAAVEPGNPDAGAQRAAEAVSVPDGAAAADRRVSDIAGARSTASVLDPSRRRESEQRICAAPPLEVARAELSHAFYEGHDPSTAVDRPLRC
jgi:hypothetical protein